MVEIAYLPQQLRAEALALVLGNPPAPWSAGVYVYADEVIAAGWDAAERVLLVSHDGYSLSDSQTDERLMSDRGSAVGYSGLSGTWLLHSPSAGCPPPHGPYWWLACSYPALWMLHCRSLSSRLSAHLVLLPLEVHLAHLLCRTSTRVLC